MKNKSSHEHIILSNDDVDEMLRDYMNKRYPEAAKIEPVGLRRSVRYRVLSLGAYPGNNDEVGFHVDRHTSWASCDNDMDEGIKKEERGLKAVDTIEKYLQHLTPREKDKLASDKLTITEEQFNLLANVATAEIKTDMRSLSHIPQKDKDILNTLANAGWISWQPLGLGAVMTHLGMAVLKSVEWILPGADKTDTDGGEGPSIPGTDLRKGLRVVDTPKKYLFALSAKEKAQLEFDKQTITKDVYRFLYAIAAKNFPTDRNSMRNATTEVSERIKGFIRVGWLDYETKNLGASLTPLAQALMASLVYDTQASKPESFSPLKTNATVNLAAKAIPKKRVEYMKVVKTPDNRLYRRIFKWLRNADDRIRLRKGIESITREEWDALWGVRKNFIRNQPVYRPLLYRCRSKGWLNIIDKNDKGIRVYALSRVGLSLMKLVDFIRPAED